MARRLAVPAAVLVLLGATGLWARLALAPEPVTQTGQAVGAAPLAAGYPVPAYPAPRAFFLPAPAPGMPGFARPGLDETPDPALTRPRPTLMPAPAPGAPASARPAVTGRTGPGSQRGPAVAASPRPAVAVTLARPGAVPPRHPLTGQHPRSNTGSDTPPATALLRSPVPPARTAPPAPGLAQRPCSAPDLARIPARPQAAPDGQAMAARLPDAAGPARDDAVSRALLAGNLPAFQRHLLPVTLTGPDGRGGQSRITLCVMPDYLALGTDADFLRVPMGLPAAIRIADAFDMMLPTPAMVDAIHAQARVRLTPVPIPPGPRMASTDWFVRHNATLEQQRGQAGGQLGDLVSGHKKDLVITPRLRRAVGRVAIYGWHRPSGQPIQPLSTVHAADYADYSHGVRLISQRAYLNGEPTDLRVLLADPRHAAILSPEGMITEPVLATARP